MGKVERMKELEGGGGNRDDKRVDRVSMYR